MSKTHRMVICLVLLLQAITQHAAASESHLGTVRGTVFDGNDALVAGATATLEGSGPEDQQTMPTNEDGVFEFHGLKPEVPYRVQVTAPGFTGWSSETVLVKADQDVVNLTGIKIQIAEVIDSVTVSASNAEIATEQVRFEEQQRVLGIFPNFYVVYDSANAVPLTPKLKFKLALKVSTDPITLGGVAFLAGINQAANTPNYVLGAKGYGQRVGAVAAGGFSDILVGGAILPSLLHQDPRYFYQGTGTTKSRARHAFASPFICRGDNGKQQPNYSTIGGGLISSALTNAYYPESNRGTGLMFQTFAINTAERLLSSFAQEFILPRFTSRGGHGH